MNISEVIKELNSRIKAKYPDFRGSYLFGSYAKGTYNEDSDVDVVLIFDEKPNRDVEMGICGISGDIDYEYDVITIPLTYTMQDLEKNYVFHNEVVNKGIYYDAA